MKCKLTVYPLKTLARAAGGAALDAAEAVHEKAAAAGLRVEERLSRVRLEREIRDIEEEIGLQMRAAGEVLYAARSGEASAGGEIEKIMEYVDGLQEELKARRRKKEVLKGKLICSACGEANRSSSLYCQNCGNPLSWQ